MDYISHLYNLSKEAVFATKKNYQLVHSRKLCTTNSKLHCISWHHEHVRILNRHNLRDLHVSGSFSFQKISECWSRKLIMNIHWVSWFFVFFIPERAYGYKHIQCISCLQLPNINSLHLIKFSIPPNLLMWRFPKLLENWLIFANLIKEQFIVIRIIYLQGP